MQPSLLLALLLLLTPTILLAQTSEPPHAIRIGANRAFFGAGDVVGPTFYAEYSYQLSPYVAVAPRAISGFAHRQDFSNLDHLSSFAINLSVCLSPLPRFLPGWTLDVGGLYHRFTNTYGNLTSFPGTPSTANDASHYSENLWGFVGAINGDVIHQEQYAIGVRLELLTSLSEGFLNADSYQLGVYYSRSF